MWGYLKRLFARKSRVQMYALWSVTDGHSVYTLWVPNDFALTTDAAPWLAKLEDLASGRCEWLGLPPELTVTISDAPDARRATHGGTGDAHGIEGS